MNCCWLAVVVALLLWTLLATWCGIQKEKALRLDPRVILAENLVHYTGLTLTLVILILLVIQYFQR